MKKRKQPLSKKEIKRKKKLKEEEKIEYETWGDVLRELPIAFVVAFLLIPLIYFAGSSIVFAWGVIQQIWVYLLSILIILGLFFYFKYYRV